MVRDWIEPKTLPVFRLIAARIDRRWYDVVIQTDRVIVSDRPTGAQRCFYLLHQLEDFCVGLGSQSRQEPAQRRTGAAVQPWRGRWQPRLDATSDELKNEVARLHETITILRNKRRQAEGERDRWHDLARRLEAELLALRGLAAGGSRPVATDKFRRARSAMARLTHPDVNGATGIEAHIRERLFKEVWAAFERIETEL